MNILGEIIAPDHQTAYDILTVLSELHGRICDEIGNCGDMEQSTKLADRLLPIARAYNVAEHIAANFDNREPVLLELE